MWYAKPSGPYVKESIEGTANILEMRDILRQDFSWTDEAITGAISNSIYEGGLNPWRRQSDTYPPPSGQESRWGCGLFGFTPYTRYIDTTTYPYSVHMNFSTSSVTTNVLADVGRQQVEIMASGSWGWVSTGWRSSWDPSLYPQEYMQWLQIANTYGDGTHLTESQYSQMTNIADCVLAFLCCFEGPRTPNYTARLSVANDVYTIITGHPPTPPTPPTPSSRKGMPVYMMIKRLF